MSPVKSKSDITTIEDSKGITAVDARFDVADARRYFAKMDGTANDTAAFDKSFSVSKQTQRLYGTYSVADLTLDAQAIDGQNIGKFIAAGGATNVLVVNNTPVDSWHYKRIKDLEIDATGDSIRTVNGITLDLAGDHLAAGLIVDGCYITNADKGINKPNGSIGDHIRTTTVKNCNYGYFAENATRPIQHVGANRIEGGEWSGNKKSAFYLDPGTQNCGQTIWDACVIEGNVAFGIYINNYNLASTAPEIRNCWFENNNTGAADIDLGFGNGSQTPRDVYARNTDYLMITGCHITDTGMEFVNSMVTMDGCFFSRRSVLIQDSESVVRCINANLNGIDSSADVVIESLTQQRGASGNSGVTGMRAKVLPRTHIVKKLPGTGASVYSETFADCSVALVGATGTRTVGGGNCGLYKYHNRFKTTKNKTYSGPLAALVLNKWYVYTMDMMLETDSLKDIDIENGRFDLAVGFEAILNNNVRLGDWVTMGGVTEYTDSAGAGNARWKFRTTSSTAPFVNVGPVQIIQFDTQKEAIEYFNSRAFYQGNDYEYSGNATLRSGKVSIDFTSEGYLDQPDTLYNIELTSNSSTHPYYSSKATTGFTINGGTTEKVMWRVYRRDE